MKKNDSIQSEQSGARQTSEAAIKGNQESEKVLSDVGVLSGALT